MALKVELKPRERIIVGQVVIRNDEQRTRFFIEGEAPILREKDILTAATADSPAKKIYFAISEASGGADPARSIRARAVRKGGRVVCGGIHMSDIPAMPYSILWEERELVSVANLTRKDAQEFFPVAKAAGVRTHTATYPLDQANEALADLRAGRISGAAVLVP